MLIWILWLLAWLLSFHLRMLKCHIESHPRVADKELCTVKNSGLFYLITECLDC